MDEIIVIIYYNYNESIKQKISKFMKKYNIENIVFHKLMNSKKNKMITFIQSDKISIKIEDYRLDWIVILYKILNSIKVNEIELGNSLW